MTKKSGYRNVLSQTYYSPKTPGSLGGYKAFQDELKAKSAWKHKRIFSKADRNDDGLLSKEELTKLKGKYH